MVPRDEGKVRGEGIFALSFDYGNGLSSFALAEVRGGPDPVGADGKAGLRESLLLRTRQGEGEARGR